MPITFGPNIVEGKVHKQKKKTEADGEKAALRELQTLLSSKNRKPCNCEAQVHDLLENCLRCGRLTCTAEAAGLCFTCGSLVLSQEQRERLNKYIDVKQHIASSAGPSQSCDSVHR